jgi:hypothetical protein
MVEIKDYIASQINHQNMDELQRLVLAYSLGFNIALDGPPGVGKTHSVLTFVKMVDKQLFEKGCSEDTTENQIIAFPRLGEKNGATITTYENGPLCKAMLAGGVFYADEFNLLKKDKQKKLNSALDDRRRITRADDVLIKSRDGFTVIISYNPSRSLSIMDLEDSVADRFVHFHYQYMMPKVEAFLGIMKAVLNTKDILSMGQQFGIKLEKRAICISKRDRLRQVQFFMYSPGGWIDFFTGEKAALPPEDRLSNISIYYAYKVKEDNKSEFTKNTGTQKMEDIIKDFSLRVSTLFSIIRGMMRKGSAAIPSAIKKSMDNLGQTGELNVHPPSLRIQTCAVSHLIALMQMGMHPVAASEYAATLILDQICFGKYRERKAGEHTNYEIVSAIASNFGFRVGEKPRLNTDFNK